MYSADVQYYMHKTYKIWLKQPLLAHILAQFVEKPVWIHFFHWPPLYVLQN